MTPKITDLNVGVDRKLLAGPHRADLERHFGPQALALWEAEVKAFDPAIEEDLIREAKLGAEYTELVASAEIEFDGKQLNLSQLHAFVQEPDRELRHGSQQAYWEFFGQNGAELDGIYHDLVQLRHRMARKLGYQNFIELGYRRMRRIDYGRREVERFRELVVRDIVPLAAQICANRARRLGIPDYSSWDEPLADPRGNPRPLGEHDWIVDRAREAFAHVHPELARRFAMMIESELLDLKTRPHKAAGGFCTSFSLHGMPFIFANFNGTQDDVGVLVHEMGHAFQNWLSSDKPLLEYFWPTSEAAEINSMGLEMLALPHMEAFFGADAERFRTAHVEDAFRLLAYVAAVDHYQHLVYASPDAAPVQRHRMWQEMEARYLPWRRYGDLKYPAGGGLWQRQLHLYNIPFYFIDYALAQCCALQFWAISESDYRSAVDAYVALCRRGGEAPFRELIASANLGSPFDHRSLSRIVDAARAVLSP